MTDDRSDDENGTGMKDKGTEGLQLKQKITQAKGGDQAKLFDYGASMLGTDNEAGTTPDKDEMATARNAPPPKE